MSDKTLRVMYSRDDKPGPARIAWGTAELAYSAYAARYGGGQTLERLSERGGFHASELDTFLPGWRDREDELVQLRVKLSRAEALRDDAERALGDAILRAEEWERQAKRLDRPEPLVAQIHQQERHAVLLEQKLVFEVMLGMVPTEGEAGALAHCTKIAGEHGCDEDAQVAGSYLGRIKGLRELAKGR